MTTDMTTDMTATLAPEQGTSLTIVSETLTEFEKVAAGLGSLQQRFAGVVYDVTTGKGMDQAKADRMEVREVRYAVQGTAKKAKDTLNEQKKLIEEKAAYIVGEITRIEDPIDATIKAEEKRKADEKAARDRAERERIAAIADKLAAIRAHAVLLPGTHSTEIDATMCALVAAVPTEAEFGDMHESAMRAFDETVQTLKRHRAAAVEHERRVAEMARQQAELAAQQAAAKIEADRLAAERRAEEQRAAAERKAAQDKLDAERREFERQQASARAEAAAIAKAAADKLAAERAAEEARAAAARREAEAVAQADRDKLAAQIAAFEAAQAQASAEAEAAAKATRDAEEAAAAEVRRLAAVEAQRVKDEQDAEDARRRALQLEADQVAREQAAAQAAALDRVQRAGPVLLAALQRLVQELVDSDDEGLIEHSETIAAARTAIALATGG